jgi:hypothetical protein
VHRCKHDRQPLFHLIELLHLYFGVALEVEAIIGTHDGHRTQRASDGFGRAILLMEIDGIRMEELVTPATGNHAMRRPEMVAERIDGDVLVAHPAFSMVFAVFTMFGEVFGHDIRAAASLARDGAVVTRVSQMAVEILLASEEPASE